MSVVQNIPDFRTGVYTVSRPGAGTVSAGVYTPGAATTFTIDAVVQPVGHDLRVVPEGRRVEDVRRIYTVTLLRSTASGPDVVTIDGDPYEVFRVDGPWTMDGETHYVAYAARQTVPGAG